MLFYQYYFYCKLIIEYLIKVIVFYITETDKFERTEFSYICETLHDRMFMNSNVRH